MDMNQLPDGSHYASWSCETIYQQTYHVAISHPLASDDNPGTAEAPFCSINRAAQLLKAGERVIIHAGIYREKICPVNGGHSPTEMISYEAATGEQVIISGAEVWQVDWTAASGYKQRKPREDYALEDTQINHNVRHDDSSQIWQGKLPGHVFAGVNPFGMTNTPAMNWYSFFWDNMPVRYAPQDSTFVYLRRRGLLFADGKLLVQVRYPYELWDMPGTYWVEDDGLGIHFRLHQNVNPREIVLEYTAREQGFVPESRNLGYIRLKGLYFEKYGNGFMPPQKGAISTNCGHHWIIEDCIIDWVNSVGIDLGFLSHYTWQEGTRGNHVIRNNRISHCGITGICGLPLAGYNMTNLLIENNRMTGNCWHQATETWECAAIKIHRVKDSIIRNNCIDNTIFGHGIWIDYLNQNSRITNNTLIDCTQNGQSAIFVEASQAVNEVDHNLILTTRNSKISTGGNGVLATETDFLRVCNNIILGVEGSAICLSLGSKDRIVNGRGPLGVGLHVSGNLMHDNGRAITIPHRDAAIDCNLYGVFRIKDGPWRVQESDLRLNFTAWQGILGMDLNGKTCSIQYRISDDQQSLVLDICDHEERKQHTLRIDHCLSTDLLFSVLFPE